jgi:serine/threonine protein kinase
LDVELLWREVKILKELSHPSIIHFYEHFEDDSYYYLVRLHSLQALRSVLSGDRERSGAGDGVGGGQGAV